jgi:ribonuclease-3
MLEPVNLRDLARREDNYKSLLLEHVQALGWSQPQYRVLNEAGPSHDRVFTVEVVLGTVSYGHGKAGSKKKAEQLAAGEALARLRTEEPDDA